MRFYLDQIIKNGLKATRWQVGRHAAKWTCPDAAAFFEQLVQGAPHAVRLVDVLPDHRVLHLAIPKAASARIRVTLSEISGRRRNSFKPSGQHGFGNPPRMTDIDVRSFYNLATDDRTLRFAFVRNPYERLVSAWASKFQNKPLIAGKWFRRATPEMDRYLVERCRIDKGLPAGAEHTLSFADFVTYATAVASRNVDYHLTLQTALLTLPGISIDVIGKVETFANDIVVLFDHTGAGPSMRASASTRINQSNHLKCVDYFSPELTKRVYRAYQQDFDQLGYPRALPT